MPPRLHHVHSLRSERVRAISAASSAQEGGGGWTPADEGDNLALWLDANQLVTNSGGAVELWTDPTDAARFAARSSIGEETALETGVQNGLKAIKFVSKWMPLTWTAPGASAHFFVAGRGNPTSPTAVWFSRNSPLSLLYVGNGGTNVMGMYSNGTSSTSFNVDPAVWRAWHVWEYANFGLQEISYFINGVLNRTQTGITFYSAYNLLGYDPANMATDQYIGEIAVFKTSLTGDALTNARTYFSRWQTA